MNTLYSIAPPFKYVGCTDSGGKAIAFFTSEFKAWSQCGECAWSGIPIHKGASVRWLASGYDPVENTYSDKTMVLERFVNVACQHWGIWTFTRVTPPTILEDYPDKIEIVMSDATIRMYERGSDRKWRKNGSWSQTKEHNFKRALSACVAYRCVHNNAERQSQEVGNG